MPATANVATAPPEGISQQSRRGRWGKRCFARHARSTVDDTEAIIDPKDQRDSGQMLVPRGGIEPPLRDRTTDCTTTTTLLVLYQDIADTKSVRTSLTVFKRWMPWKEQRTMSLKLQFVERAAQKGSNLSALCEEFGVSRQTGHKWLRRYRELGPLGLVEQSRRPDSSPGGTGEDVVLAILALRNQHPSWGPDKISRVLQRGFAADAPSRSTVVRILRRLGKVKRRERPRRAGARRPGATFPRARRSARDPVRQRLSLRLHEGARRTHAALRLAGVARHPADPLASGKASGQWGPRAHAPRPG